MQPEVEGDLARTTSSPPVSRICAVVNPVSGSVKPGAEDELRELIAGRGHALDLFLIEEQNIEQVVRQAVDKAPDLLIVLAGDGTAGLAAEQCGPDGPLLAPLPGGTMNMLPHALYGAVPWQEALRAALEHGVARPVSGGRVDGHAFYVAAVLGAPALWAQAREALRAGRWLEVKRRADMAWRRAFAGGLRFAPEGGAERNGEALVLICPLVSKALDEEQALELAALDFKDAREMARLALSGVTGAWRDDPAVACGLARRGWARMRGSIPAILDGESFRLPRLATFEFVPRAFRALAPPDAAMAIL
ncbi:MAG TPA: diacylglycerol kinase family protein [Caulobacteraceae bacterium]|jgi:diacylglycerol kinase family enzyme|nr:diacylglycerol kinase family protein [Caulobacteraceae bacterium]